MSNVWEFMGDSLPPGFQFHPTDEELVDHYLTNYIHGIKDDISVIPVVDDLFKWDPSELPRIFRGSPSIIRSRDPEWWFLSTLRYKSPNSDKFDRSTNTGSWKITGRPKEICDQGVNRQIAGMRNLVFCENSRNEEANWVMHEYYLSDVSMVLTLREQRKYVLCHLVNRQHDYTKTSTRMEVDLDSVEPPHGFSEETIEAKIGSLMDGPSSLETRNSLFMIRAVEGSSSPDSPESVFGMSGSSPFRYFNDMEQVVSTSGGDEDDDILDPDLFSSDEERPHSSEFEVELEETSRPASEHAVLKESRWARPSETLEGYVVVDETSGFVEAGDASSLPDSPKSPPTKFPRGNGARTNPAASLHKHSVCYARRIEVHSEANELSKRSQASRPRDGNERIPITSSRADDGCRTPVDYFVNLGVGIVLLVSMMLWLLLH